MFLPEQIEGIAEWAIFKDGFIAGIREDAPDDVKERYRKTQEMLEDARKNGYYF